MIQGVRGKVSRSLVSEEAIGAKPGFDPGKCQKEIFASLPAVFLAGLLNKLSKV